DAAREGREASARDDQARELHRERAPDSRAPGARPRVGTALLRRVHRLPRDAPPRDPGALARRARAPGGRGRRRGGGTTRPSPARVPRARKSVPPLRARAPLGGPAYRAFAAQLNGAAPPRRDGAKGVRMRTGVRGVALAAFLVAAAGCGGGNTASSGGGAA